MTPKYKIHPIPLFKISQYPKAKMTWLSGFDETITMAWYSWFIEGDAKRILVDAGSNPEAFIARGDNVTIIQDIDQGLRKLGLTTADVDMVICTHLHDDHFGLSEMFSNAEFLAQKAEFDFARNPHPLMAGGYPESLREKLESTNFKIVQGDMEISPGLKVIHTPGHSPGGQSVVINTVQGVAVITGFCCNKDAFNPPDELKGKVEFLTPGIFLNGFDMYASMEKVCEIADIPIALHDSSYIDQTSIG